MAEFTPQILRFDSLPSTNLEAAKRALEGEPEGLCVVASEQTAGRGRWQRHWASAGRVLDSISVLSFALDSIKALGQCLH